LESFLIEELKLEFGRRKKNKIYKISKFSFFEKMLNRSKDKKVGKN